MGVQNYLMIGPGKEARKPLSYARSKLLLNGVKCSAADEAKNQHLATLEEEEDRSTGSPRSLSRLLCLLLLGHPCHFVAYLPSSKIVFVRVF